MSDERALARDRREHAALPQQRRAPGEQRQRAADEEDEDAEDEDAARRVGGEGMHRGQHARADEEGAEQREREGQDREQDRPDLQRVALLHHHGRMEQRRAGEPGHQRGVLDRIPEPAAAPAELVIGPVGAHRDAERQEDPGEQRPGPHGARPGRVDAPVDQRRDGEGEGDREADIAEIEQRRMDREAEILQDRVEVLPFDRRRHDAARTGSR